MHNKKLAPLLDDSKITTLHQVAAVHIMRPIETAKLVLQKEAATDAQKKHIKEHEKKDFL